MPDSSEKQIGFTSKTLTSIEKKVLPVGRGSSCLCVWSKMFQLLFAGLSLHIADRSWSHYEHSSMRVKFHSKPQRIQWWSSILWVRHHLPKDRPACKCRCLQLTSISVYTAPETSIPAELVLLVQSLQDALTTAAHISMWTRRDFLLARV